jgi:hypothetical protein
MSAHPSSVNLSCCASVVATSAMLVELNSTTVGVMKTSTGGRSSGLA